MASERVYQIKVCPFCLSDRWDHGFGFAVCQECGKEYADRRNLNPATTVEVIPLSLLEEIAEELEARVKRARQHAAGPNQARGLNRAGVYQEAVSLIRSRLSDSKEGTG